MANDKKYYELFHSYDDNKIIIRQLRKIFFSEKNNINDDLYRYNDNYYFSTNRKKLKEKALYIRVEWEVKAKEAYEKAWKWYEKIKCNTKIESK
jgi:hypothetical protein